MTPGLAEESAACKYHMDFTGACVEQRLRVVAVSSAQLDAFCSGLAGLLARLEREVLSIHIQDASAVWGIVQLVRPEVCTYHCFYSHFVLLPVSLLETVRGVACGGPWDP